MGFFALIKILYTVLAFNCTIDYFNKINLGVKYEGVNSEIDICEIIRIDPNFSDEDKRALNETENDCIAKINTEVCNDFLEEMKGNFINSLREAAKKFTKDDNVECIVENFKQFKVYESFFKFFTNSENVLSNFEDSDFKKELEVPIRIAANMCNSDEIYGNFFDEIKVENSLLIEPCEIKYLVEKGFLIANFSDELTDCEEKKTLFIHRMSQRNFSQFYTFVNCFTSSKTDIEKCFYTNIHDKELPLQIKAIDYSLTLRSKNFDIDRIKEKYIQLMKNVDQIAFACTTKIY
ncbi:hypothetical protein PVAND_009878 [Polypedilum vanderplanki]|uniref:Uncharacterized protein n=1 Tax=Polypedilum vanderplanki TaxID=319348 RepID=A0A9J6CDW4_POLVA|nr:hypothetical protein PVAND_009878 [Polypedilum vanderplanki]